MDSSESSVSPTPETERLALLLQGLGDGIWDWDLLSGRLEYSPCLLEQLGHDTSADLPPGWDAFAALVHPGDQDSLTDSLRSHLERGQKFDLELRMRASTGVYCWFRVQGQAQWDASGRPTRMVGMHTDITERRFNLQLLQESEASFRSLSAASPLGIFKTNADGQCVYCNQRWQEITGVNDFEALGEGWGRALHPADRELVLAAWTAYAEEGKARFELEFRVGPEGSERWVRSRANPVHDHTGVTLGHVGTMEDVTGRRLAERSLAEAHERAMQALRVKSEFLANMSHEIRTPLNGVIGMTELLQGTALDDEQHDFVRTINTSADALLNIINDILDFSKIEAGKLNIESVDVDLREQLEDVAELVAVRAREHGLELVVDVDSSLPRNLMGDPVRIRQILLNLASNAIKFTESGEVVMGATQLADEGQSSRVKLWVRDSGIGIAPERLAAVFESFTQADGSTTRKYGGTGLGLTICRQLIHLMGGTIHVASEVGAGSEFWVELPMPHANTSPLSTRRYEMVCDLSGTHVLVVDDHPLNRRIFVEMLRGWGCRPEGAASGEEALGKLEREGADPFTVVLLDFRMNGIDGSETAARLQQMPGAATRVVLMLSSVGSVATAEERQRLGVNAWLTKPVREVSLHRALCGSLGQAQAMRADRVTPRGSVPEADHRGLALLLVEDNEVNRKVALRMLQKLGATADVAVNGREAVRMTAERHYDAVFMDCQMPEMDGFEATAAIRAREAGGRERLRIVAMTANAMEGDRERCLECGMDDYVSKPVKLERLADQLEAIVERRPRAA